MSASPAAEARPREVLPRWCIALFWIGIVALYVGLRSACLEADAPRRLAHGNLNTELIVEPVAKAHEARNWAMTGSFKTNPADNYQFWRPQSPFWVYPLAGAFRVFGTTYATLRMTATLFGLVGLLGVILIAHKRWGPSGAVMAGIFLATDNVGIAFGRSGLLEPIVAAWLVVALYMLDRAFDHVAWLIPAMLLTVLALGTKLAALPALPVFLFYGVWVLRRPAGVGSPRAWRIGLVALGLSIGVGLAAYASTAEFQRTLAWNFRHMVLAQEGGTAFDFDSVDPTEIGPGLAQIPMRLRLFWFAFSAMGLLGLAEAILRVRELFRRRITARDFLPAAMFFSFAIAIYGGTVFGYRFVLLLGPPLLLLAVDLVHRVAARIRDKRGAVMERRSLLAATGLYAVLHLGAWGYSLSRRTYEVQEAAQLLQSAIGDRDDAVCIGLWSAPIAFETTCTHYYVKSTFNSTKEQLVALKPTHLIFLDEKDDTLFTLKRRWPELLAAAIPVARFEIRTFGLELLRVGDMTPKDPAPGPKKKKKKKRPADADKEP